jgi:hypothetical protein
MITKFKARDLVRCVDASDCQSLTEGKIYTIIEFGTNDEFVRVTNDRNIKEGFFSRRFELVEQPLEANPEIFEYEGRKYRYATKADIGKQAWYDDRKIDENYTIFEYVGSKSSHSQELGEIEEWSDYKYTSTGTGWRFAVVDCTDEQIGQEPDTTGQPAETNNSEPKFKVGDQIRYMDDANKWTHLTKGKVYEVLRLDEENDPYVKNDIGDSRPYCSSSFGLVQSSEPKEPESTQAAASRRVEYRMLCQEYVDALEAFDRASTRFSEVCDEIKAKLPAGTSFVYKHNFETCYAVTRDTDGFEFQETELI